MQTPYEFIGTLAANLNMSGGALMESLGYHVTSYSNLRRNKRLSTRMCAALLQKYRAVPGVTEYLESGFYAFPQPVTLVTKEKDMETILPTDRPEFSNIELLGNWCATHIGDTIYDLKVDILFQRKDDSTEDGHLQFFRFWITGAEEYHALEDFVKELERIYGDEWGHDFVTRIKVIDFTQVEATAV